MTDIQYAASAENLILNMRIETEGIEVNDEYFLNWKVEQVNANMLNADEVEIKAVIALEAIVFKKVEQNFVTEIIRNRLIWRL